MAGLNLMRGLRSVGKRVLGGSDVADHVAIHQYRVASTTDPATITTGAWRDVPLATTVRDGITGASLAASVVTLPAGSFLLEYRVSAYLAGGGGAPFEAQCQIHDLTAEADVADSGGSVGRGGESGGSATVDATIVSHGSVVVSPAAENEYKLQVRTSVSALYAKQSAWTSQAVAEIKITKL